MSEVSAALFQHPANTLSCVLEVQTTVGRKHLAAHFSLCHFFFTASGDAAKHWRTSIFQPFFLQVWMPVISFTEATTKLMHFKFPLFLAEDTYLFERHLSQSL